jgi:sarcosine oxidase subunit gamma
MNAAEFATSVAVHRFGLKGPRAAQWLSAHGLDVPAAPNSWDETRGSAGPILVARLGSGEFFLEDCAGGTTLCAIEPVPESYPAGVYPVLRADAAFVLSGPASHDVLAQVCNVNFADLDLGARPVILTSMIGVAVLVVPQDASAERRYRIWCDPTFGPYLRESLGTVASECGVDYRGVAA